MNLKSICLGIFLLLMLSGCDPWHSGGGHYFYQKFDPSTNATITVVVDSAREVGAADVQFDSNGTVSIKVEEIQPGPNNMGQALLIIRDLTDIIKAGAAVAVP